MLCGISTSFPVLFRTHRQVAHALLTRPPLIRGPKSPSPFDLNVLGTPPAFILSQDQTLDKWYFISLSRSKIWFVEFCFLAYSFTYLKELYEIVFTISVQVFLDFLVLCTFSSVVQFSRTAPPHFQTLVFPRRNFSIPRMKTDVNRFFEIS